MNWKAHEIDYSLTSFHITCDILTLTYLKTKKN